MILNDIICDYWRDSRLREHNNIMKLLFANISVEMPNGTFKYPVLGTGLGYYEVAKAIINAAILEDCYIVRMFNDDILIDSKDYVKGRSALESFGLIMNEKECGTEYKRVALFAGRQISKLGKSQAGYIHQGLESSVFTKRYHWQRKAIASMLSAEITPYMGYHLERFFGYEFYPSEYLSNPENLGVNKATPPVKGWSCMFHLARIPVPAGDTPDDLRDYLRSNMKKADYKAHHFKRKAMWRNRRYEDTRPYEWVQPKVVERKTQDVVLPDQARLIPMWQEIREILQRRRTTLKYTHGLSGNILYNAIRECRYSQNPYKAYATGGEEILSPYYIYSPIGSEVDILTTLLIGCESIENDFVARYDPTFLVEEGLRDLFVEENTERITEMLSDSSLLTESEDEEFEFLYSSDSEASASDSDEEVFVSNDDLLLWEEQ
jgi:hypothetical protein